MNFNRFLTIVRARLLLLLFTIGITVATTFFLTLQQPPRYLATASIVLSFNEGSPFGELTVLKTQTSSFMMTQLDIISSKNVALNAVDILLSQSDTKILEKMDAQGFSRDLDRKILAEKLSENMSVKPPSGSRVIDIRYESQSPDLAATLANTFAEAYIETTLEISMGPARRNAVWFEEQLTELRQRVAVAQATLTEYQMEKKIIVTEGRLDTEVSRVLEISKNYVAAQAKTFDVVSRELGKNHPEYVRAIRQENSLKRSLDAQKLRILELKKQGDQLQLLAREVENEREVYEATLQNYYKTLLESRFDETNITILNPATAPGWPVGPDMKLNLLSALLLGTLLSFALVFGFEMAFRKVRSAADVDELLGIPVLATV